MALSRQGRRLTGPVPNWAGGLGAFILFAYITAFAVHTGSVTKPVDVTYDIGVQGLADVEFTSPDGRLHRTRTATMSTSFAFHRGEKASITATGVGGVLVTCRLRLAGDTVAEFTGQNTACGGRVGDPATYLPPPITGSVNAPAQVGDLMELPRYSGKSSPVTGRLTDHAAGISYARLGGGWGAKDQLSHMYDSTLTLRQESRPERGWFALYGSARMNPELLYRYTGDNRLFQAALAQQDAYTWTYSDHTTYRDIVSQPLTIDHRKAWVITRQETFGPNASTSIRADLRTVVLIDTGLERPAYLFVSMPDPAHDYLPDLNRLISSIRVL
ncbi:hypothetical protein ACQP25_29710 [Microtetraspora malaysiensis]|uniref:hypothetical protein n=1 Tax=Microtetraspora malaysiensis TaxID=161358 RepID=UPI003D8F835A